MSDQPFEEITPEIDLRGVKKNLCQHIRICPASQYLVCGCVTKGHEHHKMNCWELDGKPCCKRDEFRRCLTCEIYLEACDFHIDAKLSA